MSFVDWVLGDEPGIPKKPDPVLFNEHIFPRYANVDRERILMVGDTDVDIQFARNSGIASCWVRYGYGDAKKCERLMPEYQASGIVEIPSFVGTAAETRKPAGQLPTAA
jgi:phosphoglycolate phosphatase